MTYQKEYKEKENAYLEAQEAFWQIRDEWIEALEVIAVLEKILASKKEV